jgi:hypothetical protein
MDCADDAVFASFSSFNPHHPRFRHCHRIHGSDLTFAEILTATAFISHASSAFAEKLSAKMRWHTYRARRAGNQFSNNNK